MSETLEGAKALDEALKMLPEKIQRLLVGKALLEGAKITASEMKARCPIGAEAHVYKFKPKNNRTGTLLAGMLAHRPPGYGKRQIRARLAQHKEMGKIAEIVGDGRISAAALAGVGARGFYLKFVEYGWMLTSHGKSRAGRRKIKHIPAKPFLRPSWDSTKQAALNRIGEVLGQGIEAAARLGGSAYAAPILARLGAAGRKLIP